MAFVDSLFQSEYLPVLETAMSFTHQKQLVIMNNIANVETPRYKRQAVNGGEFMSSLRRAIEERRGSHPGRFQMDGSFDVEMSGSHMPMANRIPGLDAGPERHDENTVVIEREMAELAKNTMALTGMQRLYKKKLDLMMSSLRDRVI